MIRSTKKCPKCDTVLPIGDFAKCASRYDYHAGICKKCTHKKYRVRANRQGRIPTPGYSPRSRYLWATYKIREEDYERMAAAQGGVCAICGLLPEPLAVDHDHACCPKGKSCGSCIRGLLCGKCNRMLGSARDSVETLARAIDYLENRLIANGETIRSKYSG